MTGSDVSAAPQTGRGPERAGRLPLDVPQLPADLGRRYGELTSEIESLERERVVDDGRLRAAEPLVAEDLVEDGLGGGCG